MEYENFPTDLLQLIASNCDYSSILRLHSCNRSWKAFVITPEFLSNLLDIPINEEDKDNNSLRFRNIIKRSGDIESIWNPFKRSPLNGSYSRGPTGPVGSSGKSNATHIKSIHFDATHIKIKNKPTKYPKKTVNSGRFYRR